jgi:hypothetical protein
MVADLGQLREECQYEEHQGIAMEMHDDEIFAPPSEIDVISRERSTTSSLATTSW